MPLGINGGKARYALVDNDVGPLEPGRIIDLNERTMRYFDSTLQRGLIPNVKVTPLRGDHWTPGPIAEKVTVHSNHPRIRWSNRFAFTSGGQCGSLG